MRRAYGKSAPKLKNHLDALRDAVTLADIAIPKIGRFHRLKGDRKHQFAMDLKHPHRLIIVSVVQPMPTLPNGNIDYAAITKVEIVEIVDYHVD